MESDTLRQFEPEPRRTSEPTTAWESLARVWEQLGAGCPEADTAFPTDALQLWSQITNRSVPNIDVILEDFYDELTHDLAEEPKLAEAAFQHYLYPMESSSNAFIRRIVLDMLKDLRPWYPLWLDFVVHTVKWVREGGGRDLIFLARDGLVFYALARGIGASVEDLNLWIRHQSRGEGRHVDSSPLPNNHASSPVNYVDSGCYGTLLAEIIREEHTAEHPPGALFFFSRNPHIFGYLNYVIALHHFPRGSTRTEQQVYRLIRAGVAAFDTVEVLPKPYRWSGARNGEPKPSCALCFVFAKALYEDLFEYARVRCTYSIRASEESLLESLRILERCFENRWTSSLETAPVFWIPNVKASNEATKWLENWQFGTLYPQNHIFGVATEERL